MRSCICGFKSEKVEWEAVSISERRKRVSAQSGLFDEIYYVNKYIYACPSCGTLKRDL